jgi:hypothetical protein
VQYQKGTYDATEGDFSAAGNINVNYLNVLDRPIAKVEGGADRFGRALFAASTPVGGGHLLYAGEAYHSDGPWLRGDDFRKLNGILRYSRGGQQNGVQPDRDGLPRPLEVDRPGAAARDRRRPPRPLRSRRRHRPRRDPSRSRSPASGAAARARGSRSGRATRSTTGSTSSRTSRTSSTTPSGGDQFEQKGRAQRLRGLRQQRFLSGWLDATPRPVAGFQGRLDHIPAGRAVPHAGDGAPGDDPGGPRDAVGAGPFYHPVEHAVDAEAAHPVARPPRATPHTASTWERRSRRTRGRARASLSSPKLGVVAWPAAQHRAVRQLGLGLPQQRRARVGADPRSADGRRRSLRSTRSCVRRARKIGAAHGGGGPVPRHGPRSGVSTSRPSCCSWATPAPPRPAGPARRTGFEWSNGAERDPLADARRRPRVVARALPRRRSRRRPHPGRDGGVVARADRCTAAARGRAACGCATSARAR